jgi:uncharacterized repeat protein (TIGR01451 family)
LLWPALAHAGLTVNSASVIDATTVGQGKVFTITMTVGGSGVPINNRTWRSTQVLANAVPLQCVDLSNDALTGGIVSLTPSRTFNVAAPAGVNSYAITVIANNDDTCTGGTSSPVFAATPSLVVAANPATPITFAGVATGVKPVGSSNPQEVTAAVPAGGIGDVLVAIVTTDGPTDVTPTDGAAWTLLDRSATTGGLPGDLFQVTVGVWYRVTTGTEPASYTFAWTTDANPPPEQEATASILRYSGVDTRSPINAFGTNSDLTFLPIAPGVTTTVNGSMIVRAYGADGNTTPLAFPAGTGPAITASPVVTDPAPHGRFGGVSNSSTPLNAVGSASSDYVQLGGPGPTGTATFRTTVHPIDLPVQWRAVTIALAPAIDLRVTKTESIDPVVAGSGSGNLTYVVTLKNSGVSTAPNITVNELLTLPAGVTAVVTPSAGTWATPTWSVPSLAPGASETLTVLVTAGSSAAPGTDVISDTATITGADQSLINTGDDTVTAATSIATSTSLSVAKAVTPDPVTAGTNLTYTITVNNAGPSAAGAVVLSDTLPANTTFVSLASPGVWSCTTPPVGSAGIVSCSISSLAPGSAVFTLTVLVASSTTAGTVLSNTAMVSSTTTNTNLNTQSTATTTVSASANLSVTKVDTPDPVTAGTNLTYTITVTNAGPSAASSGMLSDPLPANTTFASLAAPGGWSCTTPAVGAAGTVSCSNPTFNTGSAAFILVATVSASTPPGTVVSNTATTSSATNDPSPGNESASATTTVVSPSTLSATKTVSGQFIEGGAVTYSVVITNGGAATQFDNPGDEFTDVLPSSLTLISASATSGTAVATNATRTVTWNGALAPGASVTITIQATIGAAATGTVSNQGTVSYDANGDGANEQSALTDDPTVAGAANATTFQIAAGGLVPALDGSALVMLGAILALCGAIAVRRG